MDNKITVSASYSRKINLGKYEMAEVWHSESRELPIDTSQEVVNAMRLHLYESVKRFVENEVKNHEQS